MQRTAKLLIPFLFFLLIIPSAYAAQGDPGNIKISGSDHLKYGLFDLGEVKYSFEFTGGTMVGKSGDWWLYGSLSVNGIPKTWSNSVISLTFSYLNLVVHLKGPNSATVTFTENITAMTWDGNKGSYSVPWQKLFVGAWKYTKSGLHYYAVDVIVHYTANPGSDAVAQFTVVSEFGDIYILYYHDTGDWATDISTGINIAFSTVVSIWNNLGSKIQSLNFGVIFTLDVMGFLGALVTVFALFGYAIFQTFTVPITAFSLIMAHTANAMTVSFFMLGLVIAVLLAITLFIALWKIIILVKP